MPDLNANDFRGCFEVLHGYKPFPWQEALAEQVCAGGWPEVIDLPTASGKTACIDIALFALAVRGRDSPRRIFFVVDRRVVVNEAYLRMCRVRDRLKNPDTEVLRIFADALRGLASDGRETDEDEAPLLVSEMRGGAFRDETWVKNPLQPTVIASTVDQVGSRLLFRGYGVSPNSWPMHAGLIGNDALIFLDEAHCSRAFAQTLERVRNYRGETWAADPIETPFHFVQMTATPTQEPKNIFRLTESDHTALRQRLQAAKPTRLIEVEGRKDETTKLVDELVKQALDLAKAAHAKRVAIFVNRVKTARDVRKQLQQQMEGNAAQVELVIGSMRPVDRDDLYEQKLKSLKSGELREHPLTFVVSTQCLEVGADLDFDVLVSECASIDAIQQRFGRLDRLGSFERARGAVLIGSWQINPKQPDPVYGEALSKTWEWLKSIAGDSGEINMGIEARAGEPLTVKQQLDALDPGSQQTLRFAGEDAPVLLPAHVDMLAQTSPIPEPSPLVEFFLHGPKRGVPDVQVVWRSDLDGAQSLEEEIEIVKFCPPSSREAMPVSISVFKKWFAGEKEIEDAQSDLEIGAEEGEITERRKAKIYVLAWDGDESERISQASKIKPGQTLILKESAEGWNDLGHIPEGAPIDIGDRAAFETRNSVSLRLHPEIIKTWPESPALQALAEDLRNPDFESSDVKSRLETCRDELKQQLDEGDERWKLWPYKFLRKLKDLRRVEPDVYPGRDNVYFARARRSACKKKKNGQQVFLDDHLEDVRSEVDAIASGLPVPLQDALRQSAQYHDYGKIDVRFQAWLRNGDLMAARYLPRPIAKSGNDVLQDQQAAGLPKGFRHELLSLMFAEKSPEIPEEIRDLILHLVASHHGRCRPFAPVVLDEGAECASYGHISICREERLQSQPHRLGSRVADRFWNLTARYGWWGLAYLEALLRLADWEASEKEDAEVSNED